MLLLAEWVGIKLANNSWKDVLAIAVSMCTLRYHMGLTLSLKVHNSKNYGLSGHM